MDLYGTRVEVVFLVFGGKILAYSWHYSEERAIRHLQRIAEFHGLEGEIVRSLELEEWLKRKLDDVVLYGKKFYLPGFKYKNKEVYESIIKIPRGKTSTYTQIAKESNVSYKEMLMTLMRNPFQVLIPCHRLITNRGTLLGFYPLGKEVKKRLLEIEGVKLM